MKRIEIIANRSVEGEIVEGLEAIQDDFYYTLIPVVHGRGRQRVKRGSAIWPEENFLLIAYLSEERERKAREVVEGIKKAFPKEGIKIFSVAAEE